MSAERYRALYYWAYSKHILCFLFEVHSVGIVYRCAADTVFLSFQAAYEHTHRQGRRKNYHRLKGFRRDSDDEKTREIKLYHKSSAAALFTLDFRHITVNEGRLHLAVQSNTARRNGHEN